MFKEADIFSALSEYRSNASTLFKCVIVHKMIFNMLFFLVGILLSVSSGSKLRGKSIIALYPILTMTN